MTQQQVADRAHIGVQAYQKFEGGQRYKRTASFNVACRVLETLELDIIEFFRNG